MKVAIYPGFQVALEQAMMAAKLSQSDLARKMWGSTTNKRGHSVARNRDRISQYCAGVSYPGPEIMQKLADALGVSVATLDVEPRKVRKAHDQITDKPGTMQVALQLAQAMATLAQAMATLTALITPPDSTGLSLTENASETFLNSGLRNGEKLGPQ